MTHADAAVKGNGVPGRLALAELPQLGMGCRQFGRRGERQLDDREVLALLAAAHERGINHFGTARHEDSPRRSRGDRSAHRGKPNAPEARRHQSVLHYIPDVGGIFKYYP